MMSRLAVIAPRLAPLIRLLGSDHNGEVSAAVAGLRRLLATQELDLHDLADFVEGAAEEPIPSDDHLEEFLHLVDRLLKDGAGKLKDCDINFLANVRAGVLVGRAPTVKQQKWLGDIQVKLKVRARAG